MRDHTSSGLLGALTRVVPLPRGVVVERIDFRSHEQGSLAAVRYRTPHGSYMAVCHRVIRESLARVGEGHRGGITYRLSTRSYVLPRSPGLFFADVADGAGLRPVTPAHRPRQAAPEELLWLDAETVVGELSSAEDAGLAAELLRCPPAD